MVAFLQSYLILWQVFIVTGARLPTPTMYYKPTPLFTPKFLHGYWRTCSIIMTTTKVWCWHIIKSDFLAGFLFSRHHYTEACEVVVESNAGESIQGGEGTAHLTTPSHPLRSQQETDPIMRCLPLRGRCGSLSCDGGRNRPPSRFRFQVALCSGTELCPIGTGGLAIVFGVKRFHYYLYGRKFTIMSDHQSLKHLFGETRAIPPMASARIQRCIHQRSEFDTAILSTYFVIVTLTRFAAKLTVWTSSSLQCGTSKNHDQSCNNDEKDRCYWKLLFTCK